MPELIDTLNTLKSTVGKLKDEYEIMNDLVYLNMKYIPTYVQIIGRMESCINEFIAAENYNILHHHNLSFSILHIIDLNMCKIRDRMNKINAYNKSRSCKFCLNLATKEGRPSYIKKILELNFKEIYKNLIALEKLEEKIFGTSNRIEQPVLRKAWLLSGVNQMGNSSIKSIILQHNIYQILEGEIGDKIKNNNKVNWTEEIANLVNKLDNTIGEADDIITITELNNIDNNYMNCNTVFELLSKMNQIENKKDKKEKVITTTNSFKKKFKVIKIETNYKTVKVRGSEKRLILNNDISYELFADFNLPEDNNIYKLDIVVNAEDQGWGGTGHVCVKYAIDEIDTNLNLNYSKTAFNIDRNNPEIENNNYKFTINSDELHSKSNIKLFILCPVWNGWSGEIKYVDAELTYEI